MQGSDGKDDAAELFDQELGEIISAAAEAVPTATELVELRCEKTGYGAPVITGDQASQMMLSIPAWRRGFHDGVEKVWKDFHFVDFRDAFAFAYKLASLAEREDHHPAVYVEWGKVRVYWWTTKINGLHMNDFIMAAKTDMIAKLAAKS